MSDILSIKNICKKYENFELKDIKKYIENLERTEI